MEERVKEMGGLQLEGRGCHAYGNEGRSHSALPFLQLLVISCSQKPVLLTLAVLTTAFSLHQDFNLNRGTWLGVACSYYSTSFSKKVISGPCNTS